eukprot:TRINITY_DN2337_c1_g1_i3.p1 TRINITY_DN2337_c1_g1~~TRINITY_DN2337_c1_g1_i3.p1  ORF type:complete len:285 (+),score=72.10 TRINITY_DN2337_c1_g1_i3:114-968(+)
MLRQPNTAARSARGRALAATEANYQRLAKAHPRAARKVMLQLPLKPLPSPKAKKDVKMPPLRQMVPEDPKKVDLRGMWMVDGGTASDFAVIPAEEGCVVIKRKGEAYQTDRSIKVEWNRVTMQIPRGESTQVVHGKLDLEDFYISWESGEVWTRAPAATAEQIQALFFAAVVADVDGRGWWVKKLRANFTPALDAIEEEEDWEAVGTACQAPRQLSTRSPGSPLKMDDSSTCRTRDGVGGNLIKSVLLSPCFDYFAGAMANLWIAAEDRISATWMAGASTEHID